MSTGIQFFKANAQEGFRIEVFTSGRVESSIPVVAIDNLGTSFLQSMVGTKYLEAGGLVDREVFIIKIKKALDFYIDASNQTLEKQTQANLSNDFYEGARWLASILHDQLTNPEKYLTKATS